jgi:hypothetical protein
LPLLTASGTAKRALKATGAATLPLLTADGLGSIEGQSLGDGDGTLPLLTAEGTGVVVPLVADEQPSGGWGAYNAADAERQRRRRQYLQELEDEAEAERERAELADRLEAQLVTEGTLKPADADLLRLRGMAAQYSDGLPNRARRALVYAERAQTEMATQLALREMAKLAEEEEYALLLILTAA